MVTKYLIFCYDQKTPFELGGDGCWIKENIDKLMAKKFESEESAETWIAENRKSDKKYIVQRIELNTDQSLIVDVNKEC